MTVPRACRYPRGAPGGPCRPLSSSDHHQILGQRALGLSWAPHQPSFPSDQGTVSCLLIVPRDVFWEAGLAEGAEPRPRAAKGHPWCLKFLLMFPGKKDTPNQKPQHTLPILQRRNQAERRTTMVRRRQWARCPLRAG